MAYDVNIEVSNSEDFIFDVSATDADTGADIDFTGALATYQVVDDQDQAILTASITSGGITRPVGTTLEIAFSDTTMRNICKGSYRHGMVYQINGGITVQLFKGQLTVYDGIAVIQ